MVTKISIVFFILLQISLNGYLIFDFDNFIKQYNNTKMEIARLNSKVQDYENQLEIIEIEKRLFGIQLPDIYVEKYIKHRNTLILLATSQDCAPCTEAELNIWKEFLKGNKIKINTLCIYYSFNKNHYGKYEDIYKSIFPFVYDQDKLFEFLCLDNTPIVLLVSNKGEILTAHRPDIMNSEKTKKFINTLLRVL